MAYDDLAIGRSLWAQAAEIDVQRARLAREAAYVESLRQPAIDGVAQTRAARELARAALASRGPARVWSAVRGRRGAEVARLTGESLAAEAAVDAAQARLRELLEQITRVRESARALTDADVLRAQSLAAKERYVRDGDLPGAVELDRLDRELVAASAMARHASTQLSAVAAAGSQLLLARESLDVLNGVRDGLASMSRSQVTHRAHIDDVLNLIEGVRRDLRPVGLDHEAPVAAALAIQGPTRSVARLTTVVDRLSDALEPIRERIEATREHVRVEVSALEWRRAQLLDQV